MQSAHLDLTTLAVVLMMVTAFLCATMFFVWRVQRTYAGFGFWTFANLISAAGFLFLILRPVAPESLIMISANYLAFTSNLLCLKGNRRFLGLNDNWRFDGVLIAFYAPTMAYFTFFDNDAASRIIVSSLGLAAISASNWFIFNRSVQKNVNFAYRLARLTYLAFTILILTRAVLTLTASRITDFYAPDTLQSAVYLIFIVFAVLWTFQYLILNNERLQQELKSAQVELEKLAQTDFLTGVNNKRRFYEIGEIEINRARRFGHSLTIVLFDLDYFKRINDTHGHSAGDEVLIKVAEICRQTLRSIDVPGRLGGEEFAVLLPQTDVAGGTIVAENLRRVIEKTEIELANKQIIQFTASFGVAELKNSDSQIQIILHRADELLYQAKHDGRNRIAVEPAEIKRKAAAI